MTPGGFQAYEHRWALPAAFGFHERIGKARVTSRIHALAADRISVSVTPYAERHVRFGCGLAVDDVDAAVASVAEIARRG